MFDIYGSQNGFEARMRFTGNHMYGYNTLYTYCLESDKLYKFFKQAYRNSTDFKFGFTMIMGNPFSCSKE